MCGNDFDNNKSHNPIKIFCSNKCKFNFRKGKSWEELFGIETAKNMKVFTDKHKQKISKSLIGKFKGKTYEQIMGREKAEIRRKQQKLRFLGKDNPFYNKKHNKKTKEIMSLLKLGKTHEEIMGEENAKNWIKKMSGKNSPFWINGNSIKDYKNFTKRFKNYIRNRDNQICMICGKHREKMNTALSIHHIDYNKHNSYPNNCISLCFDCHAKTNYNRKYWIEFFKSLLQERYNYDYNLQIVYEIG